MNREQRRAYDRKIKKMTNASICPKCGHLAMFYTRNLITSQEDKGSTVLICERCETIVREGIELNRLIPPGIYLPIPLSTLDQLLIAETARIEEEKNEPVTINEGGSLEVEGSVT